MFRRHFPKKPIFLSSIFFLVLFTPGALILAKPRPVIEYVNLVSHDEGTNEKCERMKNYVLGMSRAELREQKISRKCIDYARKRRPSHKIEFSKPVTVIKIHRDVQSPPTRQARSKYVPSYTQLPMTLVKQRGIYRLTAATGFQGTSQVNQKQNQLDWSQGDGAHETKTNYDNPRLLRQAMLAVSRDFGMYHHSMLELEWFYAQIKPNKVKQVSGNCTWCEPESGSKYKIDLYALMMNLYFNTNPTDKLEFVVGAGAGMVYRKYDLYFNDSVGPDSLGINMSINKGKFNWAAQPIVGLRYRLSSVLQLMLDYRLLIMGGDTLKNFTTTTADTSVSGAFYKTHFLMHTINFGVVYQMTHEGNSTNTADRGVWVH